MQVHPSQISPGESFDIFYFLRNHTDSTTYYVRARVYDVRTGELLSTHDLAQSPTNSRLFIKTVEAPPDPGGYGRNIVAIATVYTDDIFATKSENYEEQEQYYLIKSVPPILGGGGIDARTARDIFQEELKTFSAGLPKLDMPSIPDAPDMSFVEALFARLKAVATAIDKLPNYAKDINALFSKLSQMHDALLELSSRPSFEPTDLSALSDLIHTAQVSIDNIQQTTNAAGGNLLETVRKDLKQLSEKLSSVLTDVVEKTIQSQEITLPVAMKLSRSSQQPPERINPVDAVRHLAS